MITRRDFVIGGAAGVTAAALDVSAARSTQPIASATDALRTHQAGGRIYQFRAIQPTALSPIAVVPQCLDNQWVPMAWLRQIQLQGSSRAAIQPSIDRMIRGEYIRCLVNAPQVIINRAFLKSSASVYQDYVDIGRLDTLRFSENREAFKRLINAGAVVAFFTRETSPIEDNDFATSTTGTEGWRKICAETEPHCVRLSWDDAQNTAEFRQMQIAFHNFATGLRATGGSLLWRLRELTGQATEPDELRAFARLLRSFADAADDVQDACGFGDDGFPKCYVSRSKLYEQFVLTQGSNAVDGRYDPAKPFANELKLLIDLKYNTNLSDRLNVQTLTPIDTPSRTILLDLELQRLARSQVANISDPQNFILIIKELKRALFATIQQALNFEAFADFDMRTVERVRGTEEWQRYIAQLSTVMGNPAVLTAAPGELAGVYQSYASVIAVASRLHGERFARTTPLAWEPRVALRLTLGGVGLDLTFVGQGGPIYFDVTKPDATSGASGRENTMIGRLVIGDVIERQVQDALETSAILLRSEVSDARGRADEIVARLGEDPANFQRIVRNRGQDVPEPTINDVVPFAT